MEGKMPQTHLKSPKTIYMLAWEIFCIKTHQVIALGKSIPIPKKGNPKECSNYRTIALISHPSKVMLNILQARLQQYVNQELPDVQACFRKGRGTEIKLPISTGSLKKQESSRKTSISALLTMPKPSTVWITINCGKFWKRREYRLPDLPLEKPVCRSGSNS